MNQPAQFEKTCLMKVALLILDESMSGWRPKTSKLGGSPNCAYKIRKLTPLGTMLRNSAKLDHLLKSN